MSPAHHPDDERCGPCSRRQVQPKFPLDRSQSITRDISNKNATTGERQE